MIGILLALEVSEWQEKRQLQKREVLYLDRIANELNRADKHYQDRIAVMEGTREAVKHVMNSLLHGQLEDEELFAEGIFHADVLGAVSHPITIYDEMISTGTFSQLQDEYLRDLLTQLKTTYDAGLVQLPYFRVGLQSVRAHLDDLVDWAPVPEEEREANHGWALKLMYDFEELKGNRLLKNQYLEVEDSHGDWIKTVNDIHQLILKCQARVEELRSQ